MAGIDYTRQRDWFDPDRTDAAATIVGCGGIGSFTALALAKLGVRRLTLQDYDTVEGHNLPNQMFLPRDIGIPKVTALAQGILDHGGPEVATIIAPLQQGVPLSTVTISALDSMEARAALWQLVRMKVACNLFLDARLGGEHIVLYAVNPVSIEDVEGYERTLHSDDEGVELPCTARSIIDVGFVVGSLIARSVRMHYAHQELPRITYLNQHTLDIMKGGWL